MLSACRQNLTQAEEQNSWFWSDFIDLRIGDALAVPVADKSVDVAAQNCLFNIFKENDLRRAIEEIYRDLKPSGRLVLSDPICEQNLPDVLRDDEELRALFLTGVIALDEYINTLTDCGFDTIEMRARRPYRVLSPQHYRVDSNILIESVEVCAIKDPMPIDGPCVFTCKTAIYIGNEGCFDDGKGHVLPLNQPVAVCDKTAAALQNLGRGDIYTAKSTWRCDGGGCC